MELISSPRKDFNMCSGEGCRLVVCRGLVKKVYAKSTQDYLLGVNKSTNKNK